jgi:undecaprenyl phosphate N,N'-diacetylbacillosamine 1-phosphate transferase
MYRILFKRFFDIIFSMALIFVLLPFIMVITFILSIVNNGKPFFVQERPGKNEKIFRVIKFKTMTDKRSSDGKLLPDKQRLTKIGRFIRKTSLDELPQLFNILAGNMSFIGPRPLLVNYLPYYNEFERKRHNVRPGITGLAQVNGRNFILWEKRIELDVIYAEELNFKMDLDIVLKTIKAVLNRENITADVGELGRARLDIRRNPKYAGMYDENGFAIEKNDKL